MRREELSRDEERRAAGPDHCFWCRRETDLASAHLGAVSRLDRTAPERILWASFGLFAALSESLQRLGSGQFACTRYHLAKTVSICHPIPQSLVMSSPHPASQSPGSGPGGAEGHERVAEQLQTLSQVVETITYRLLELEERLAGQESRMQDLHQQAGRSIQLSDGAEQRCDDTEERLVRLELLLNGMDASSSAPPSRHLQPVQSGRDGGLDGEERDTIDGPFLEEPEQPFMDDLEAPDPQLNRDELSA